MFNLEEQLTKISSSLHQVTIPDLWQQEAVAALRAGHDVVVHAPTGAGKTLIFELWSHHGKNRGQAIYTVPTRALANDKLAEWRARGWDVGIATGDLAENLNAPVLVATLETQKNRLIKGEGPTLLVVDEYQMIGDSDRGLNYELALAMAPPETQLLLLSGSVANPQDLVKWLDRLGRKAVLIRHEKRPVPLDEVYATNLNYHIPNEIKGYWPRLIAKALAEDLGPVLVFAPRRQEAERLAQELARQLPNPNPLNLTPEQKQLVGEGMAKLLKSRVSFHHSGLSYAARAGVVEPLAKAGQLRVVVATMGLAAGINFSLRSVALAGESYRRDNAEQPLRADEILQMFGRAGRRGLDETGYVLITANGIRLLDARPAFLSRGGWVDWAALLGVMQVAAESERDPFRHAVAVQERLFTTKPIVLGIEECLKHPDVPCGLKTDSERARHVRQRIRQFLNSKGEWETFGPAQERQAGEVFVLDVSPELLATNPQTFEPGQLRLQRAIENPAAMERVGTGALVPHTTTEGTQVMVRASTLAERLNNDKVLLTKWVRRLLDWKGRQVSGPEWENEVVPVLKAKLNQLNSPAISMENQDNRIVAFLALDRLPMKVPVDRHGIALWRPPEREVLPLDCAQCGLVEVCRELSPQTGVALLWKRLGLIDAAGKPTRRGQIVSFFSHTNGLAIAAGCEDRSYPMEEFIYDLANLDAGFRFCGEENRWAGRLAIACHQLYGSLTVPGYLENGLPPKYGSGAEQVVASVHKNPMSKHAWVTDLLGAGDIDRMLIEWRSILRQIAHAPELEWDRWKELQQAAEAILQETESPTLTDLPPLEYAQTKRVDHRLIFKRH